MKEIWFRKQVVFALILLLVIGVFTPTMLSLSKITNNKITGEIETNNNLQQELIFSNLELGHNNRDNSTSSDSIDIAFLADPHMVDRALPESTYDNMIDDIQNNTNFNKLDFWVALGDEAISKTGCYNAWKTLQEWYYSRIPTSLLLTQGNHDVYVYTGNGGYPTGWAARPYDENLWMSLNETNDIRATHAIYQQGILFLFLGDKGEHRILPYGQKIWLEHITSLYQNTTTVIFDHEGQKDDAHTWPSAGSYGFYNEVDWWRDFFNRNPQIELWINGHGHHNSDITTVNYNGDPLSFILLEAFQNGCDDKIGYLNINETEMRFRVWDVSDNSFTNNWLITSSTTFNNSQKGWISFPMFLEDNETQWFDNKILSPNVTLQLVGWHDREMFQNPNLTWFDQHQDFDWLYFGNDIEEEVRQWNLQTIPYGQNGEPYGVLSIDAGGFITFPHKNSMGYAPWDTYPTDLGQGGNCYSHIGCSYEMFGQQPPGAVYDVLVTIKTDNGTGHLNLTMNCSTENDVYTILSGSEQLVIDTDVNDTYWTYKGTFTIPNDNISIINGKIECETGVGVDWYNISYISIIRNATGDDTDNFHLRLNNKWYNSSGVLFDCEYVNISIDPLDLMSNSKVDVFAQISGNKKGFARLIYETPLLLARNGRFCLNEISQNGNVYNITITDQLSAINPYFYLTPTIYDYGNLAVSQGSVITTGNNNSFSKTLMTPTTFEVTYGPVRGVPVVSHEDPMDGEYFVPITLLNLSFNLTDPESNLMNYSVETQPFIGVGNGENVSNGRFNVSVSGLVYNTMYSWWVNVTDGVNDVNMTFSFVTAPSEPVVSNELPINSTVDVDLSPLLSIDIIDYQGDDVDWWIKSDASGSWKVLANDTLVGGNGTVFTSNTSDMDQYETMYWWSINVTDTGSHGWNNETYYFKTKIEPGGWFDSNWFYRRAIIVNHSYISSSLICFPMLFSIIDTDIGNHTDIDGSDILFTDYYGNRLNHEIEMFNSSSGELVCWVNITSIGSTEDTIVYLYYGNLGCSNQESPEGVWDSDYRLVQHLNETSGVHSDSTIYRNDCSIHGSVLMDTNGMVDGADDFDGSSGYGEVVSSSSLDVSLVTVELWAKSDLSGSAYSVNSFILNKQNTEALTYGFIMRAENDSIFFNIRLDGSELVTNMVKANDLLDTNWHHYVGTYDGSQVKLYVDGVVQNDVLSLTGSIDTDNSDILRIGNHPTNVGYFDGIIDEIRISSVSRNSSWIYASYKNQLDPSSFYNVSEEEIQIIQEPLLSNEQPLDNSTNVNLYPELQVKIADYQGDDVDWWIKSNASGVWKVLANDTLVGGNGTVSTSNTSDMDQYLTMYWWSVNATDPEGSGNWTNRTYSFKTIIETIHNPFYQGWQYRREIIVNHSLVAGNLSGYPLLIEIIDDINLSSHAKSDGGDIVFMDGAGGANQLPHEIEYYNATDGNLICWVNVSTLSSTVDTVLYMYYGNSEVENCENLSGVWDDHYILVQHLNETSSTHYDSSVYSNDGTPLNGVVQDATGIIDGADLFDGDNDYIEISDSTSLDTISTIELWLKPGKTYDTSNVVNDGLLTKRKTTAEYDGFTFCFYGGNTPANRGKLILTNDPGGGTSLSTYSETNNWNKDEWYHIAAVLDGVLGKMYVNGVNDTDTDLTTDTNSALFDYDTSLMIGVRIGSTFNYFNGTIDELRLSNIARSAEWIHTEYNNRYNLTEFFVVGYEEAAYNTFFKNENPIDGSIGINLTPNLQVTINNSVGYDVDWWIKSNASGSWKVLENDTLVGGNGTVSTINTSDMDEYETIYWWSINTSNGHDGWHNETYRFATVGFHITNPFNQGWQYLKKITINHSFVDDNFSGFPLMINIVDDDLIYHAKSDGGDIVFMDGAGGANQLPHEIEYYNATDGNLICWVNVSTLSSTVDTVLYMYYGNSEVENCENLSGVWDDHYILVQHLNETSSTHYDSSVYSNDGTPLNGVVQDATGIIDGADLFDGDNDYIEISDSTSLDTISTIELWLKPGKTYDTSNIVNDGFLTKRKTTADYAGFTFCFYGGSTPANRGKIILADDEGTIDTATYSERNIWNKDEWYHIAAVLDGVLGKMYVNGVNDTDTDLTTDTNSALFDYDTSLMIGVRIGSTFNYFNGTIDELRLSNIARSAEWIHTEYNNRYNLTEFFVVGDEEAAFKPSFKNENPIDGSIGINLTPNLQVTINNSVGYDVDWWIKSNASGSWKVLENDTLVGGNGTVTTINTSYMDEYETIYWWSVNATYTSGNSNWTNETYCFTTIYQEKKYYKQITINHSLVESNLSNFPVLISITDSDLANHTQSSGNDIKFTKTNNPNSFQYSHEIEYYNHSQGVLVCWVNITEISSINDTIFYMHYGNKTCDSQENVFGVWDANYRLVQHFEETSGLRYDSTNYGNNGSIHGGVSSTANGLIDGADDFDGSSGYIEMPSDSSLDVSHLTLEGWFRSDKTGSEYLTTGYMINHQMTNPGTFGLFLRTSVDKVCFCIRLDGSESTIRDVEADSTLDTNWHHYSAIYDGSEVKLFIDGVLQSDTETATGSIDTDNSDVLRIGNHPADSSYFDGIIDEIRISDIARNSSWIKTQYNNQNNPSTFYNIGTQETSGTDTISPEIKDVTITTSDPKDTNPSYGWENITCTVTDNTQVQTVILNITYPDMHMENHPMALGSGSVYYYNTTFTNFGSYSYYIWANDTKDNQNTSSSNAFDLPPNYDIDSNGVIDIMDINLVAQKFGDTLTPGSIREDIDNNGVIDILDISMVSYYFGETW